ncbi:esterase-like activity of phytase family protein [Cellulomonas sp.]|uniref:esterase-like activity of phytase family protein n=1 Tax=Cellulomonas sp. TaxID=40001 RepID=UPI003BAC4F88
MPHARRTLAALTCTAVLCAGLGATAAAAHPKPSPQAVFHRLATYPVYLNRPAGVPAADPTVAEISAVSEDGRTFIHTDALAGRIGFVDITEPAKPRGLGTLDLAADLGVGDHAEPTSVAVVGGYVLVVVDTSESFTNPSGLLAVVDLATHALVRTIDLGGQPDSIALTPDKAHAAIAIENQRDEDVTPAGGKKGDLPQLPGGFLQLVDLPGTDPATWTTRAVPFTAQALAGLDTPQDPEPEYVAIDPTGSTVAVTLQENNGVALVDIASGTVSRVFSAGSVAVTGIDAAQDGVINQTGSIPLTPREPDAVAWLDATHLATANEGDWKGGTRGWTVFDTSGAVVWDAGAELERLAVRTGLHSESRAGKKGVEIEGLAVATLGGKRYAFVGSERSNVVAVYDVDDAAHPRFVQALATTNGPEGILPVPSRDLLLVSSETDDASVLVRSSVTVFGRGKAYARTAGTPQFPSVVSADDAAGNPIGWGALGALSADPTDKKHLWTASDAAYSTAHLLRLDVSRTPAVIDRDVVVTQGGTAASLDIEGVSARRRGGFWLGSEGATGAANALVRTDANGAIQETVRLPADVSAGLTKWGIEGVAATEDSRGEHVWVALQRGLTDDQTRARIGRYDVRTGTWAWFAYPLGTTTTAGDWIGLSEITVVDRDTLAVIERDKLNGPDAKVKAVYTVRIPAKDPAPGTVGTLTKTLVRDLVPDLRAANGWTQEKVEGLTIGGDGQVYAITDNDGLKDATGETVLLRLGPAAKVFRAHR